MRQLKDRRKLYRRMLQTSNENLVQYGGALVDTDGCHSELYLPVQVTREGNEFVFKFIIDALEEGAKIKGIALANERRYELGFNAFSRPIHIGTGDSLNVEYKVIVNANEINM